MHSVTTEISKFFINAQMHTTRQQVEHIVIIYIVFQILRMYGAANAIFKFFVNMHIRKTKTTKCRVLLSKGRQFPIITIPPPIFGIYKNKCISPHFSFSCESFIIYVRVIIRITQSVSNKFRIKLSLLGRHFIL